MSALFTYNIFGVGLMGIFTVTVVALSVLSFKKNLSSTQPLTGLFPLILIIVTFFILIALLTASA